MVCGKVTYTSRTEAANAMSGANSNKWRIGKHALNQAYYCGECDAWHVSSNLKRSPNKRPKGITVEVHDDPDHRRRVNDRPLIIRDFTFTLNKRHGYE